MTDLALTHTRFLVVEQLRVPIAVVSAAVFPALSLLFFIVPFDIYATDAEAAATAVAQLTVFAVMSAFLFSFGIGVAEERERSWEPYLRTLPAPVWPRITGRVLTGVVFATLSVVPVVVIGALFTAADVPMARLAAGLVALWVAGLPFLLGGLAIGYSLPAKAAIPVTQLVFFPVAFGGGLLLPPALFPGWLEAFSTVLPSRGARDLVVWATVGTAPSTAALVALVAWTVAAAALVGWAYRRDEGRRYR